MFDVPREWYHVIPFLSSHGGYSTACYSSHVQEGGFQTEPDTEMVSEDELPTESSKEPLETEAVSDEELPDPTAAVDLPETEAVSEDELPPEKMDKKKKKAVAKQPNVSGKYESKLAGTEV